MMEGGPKRVLHSDERGITPVVGTLLILAITIIGMAGIMFWGAPTIERLQASNSQSAIVGEFEQVRNDAHVLSVEDSSRLPVINLPAGSLSLEQGTRIAIGTVFNGNACTEFLVEGWAVGPADADLDITVSGCAPTTGGGCAPCIRVFEVRGGSDIERTVTGGVPTTTVTGYDMNDPDTQWVVRVTSDETVTYDTWAEVWIISGDRLSWQQGTSGGEFEAHYDASAIFSGRSGSLFQEKRPFVSEQHFGESIFFFRLDTLQAARYGGVEGQGTYQVFLGLQSMHSRIDSDDVRFVRFQFDGDLAEAWCQSLTVRNSFLDGGIGNVGLYDIEGDCETGNAEHIRSVVYCEHTAPASPTDCSAPTDTFPLQFRHATIRASIEL